MELLPFWLLCPAQLLISSTLLKRTKYFQVSPHFLGGFETSEQLHPTGVPHLTGGILVAEDSVPAKHAEQGCSLEEGLIPMPTSGHPLSFEIYGRVVTTGRGWTQDCAAGEPQRFSTTTPVDVDFSAQPCAES